MYYRITSIVLLFHVLCISSVLCTIYRLNASEYSRMPALYALDDYEVCMEQVQAVYCLVKLDLYAERGNPLMHTIREYSMDVNRHYNHTNVDRGVCVNTSCRRFLAGRELTDERQLDEVLQQCMNDTVRRQYGLSARLAFKFNCDRAGERDEITVADWSFLGVAAALVLAVIGATVYDRYLKDCNRKYKGNQYILSFSAAPNFNWLFNSEVGDDRMNNLKTLHFTRFIINIMMIWAHVGCFYVGGFQKNTHDIERSLDHNSIGYLVYNGLVIVQIFFFISGFLLAYNMEIYAETKNITMKMVPLIMFKRFMRLSPGLSLMIWFTSTWLRHLGSGPLWKLHITNSVVADCQKYWWSHLLYVNNYVPDNRNCAIQTWHIAADTQVFLLALIVIIATRNAGQNYTLIVLLLLGTLAPAINVWLYNLDAIVILRPEFWRTVINDTFFYYHILGHNNLQSYVVGIAIGRLVYKYHLEGQDFSKCKLYARSHIFVIPAFAYFFYSGHVFYQESTPLLWRAVYAGVQRLIAAIITTWLILGFVLKVPSGLRTLAESRVWLAPSRLTYSVYLLHLNIIHVWLGSRRYTSDVNGFTLFLLYIGVTVLSYLLALVFYLVVEAPFNSIAKVLTSRILEETAFDTAAKTVDTESSKNK